MDRRVIGVLVENGADLMASGRCKQVADVTEVLDWAAAIRQLRSNKEDEGMGLCADAYIGGIGPAIMMQMHIPTS
jgi:sulfopyruvate decarboxylase subunit alpha